MDRTNGNRDSEQHESGDIPEAGQPDTGNGQGDMCGGAPVDDEDD